MPLPVYEARGRHTAIGVARADRLHSVSCAGAAYWHTFPPDVKLQHAVGQSPPQLAAVGRQPAGRQCVPKWWVVQFPLQHFVPLEQACSASNPSTLQHPLLWQR